MSEIDKIKDDQETEPVFAEKASEAVMEELSGEHYQPLVSFCIGKLSHFGVLNPDEVALDIVQETMLRAWKNIDKARSIHGDPEQNLQGWLFKIAQNIMIDEYHKERREKRKMQRAAISLSTPVGDEGSAMLEEFVGTRESERRVEAKLEIEQLLPLLDDKYAQLIR